MPSLHEMSLGISNFLEEICLSHSTVFLYFSQVLSKMDNHSTQVAHPH